MYTGGRSTGARDTCCVPANCTLAAGFIGTEDLDWKEEGGRTYEPPLQSVMLEQGPAHGGPLVQAVELMIAGVGAIGWIKQFG